MLWKTQLGRILGKLLRHLANMFSLIKKKLCYHIRVLEHSWECRIGFSQVPCYAYSLWLHAESAGLIVKGEGLQEQGYYTVTDKVPPSVKGEALPKLPSFHR